MISTLFEWLARDIAFPRWALIALITVAFMVVCALVFLLYWGKTCNELDEVDFQRTEGVRTKLVCGNCEADTLEDVNDPLLPGWVRCRSCRRMMPHCDLIQRRA